MDDSGWRALIAAAKAASAQAYCTPTPMYATPCGACRQVLMEFARNAEVLCACDSAERGSFTVTTLLPHAFALPAR